jgi:hypothetical protein
MKFLTANHDGQGRYYTGLDELYIEIDILKQIDHKHIIRLEDVSARYI